MQENFQNTLWPFLLCVNWGEAYSIRGEKISLKLFSTGRLVFFQKVVFPTTSWVLKDWSYNLYQKRQRTSSNLKKLFKVCHFRRHLKKDAKIFFFQRDDNLFLKNLVLSTSNVLTNWSYNFHKNCQKYLAEPYWPKNIFSKYSFFSQKVVFSTTSLLIQKNFFTLPKISHIA